MKHQQKFYTDLAVWLFSGLPQLESSIHLSEFKQDYNIITVFLTPLLVLLNYYLIKQQIKVQTTAVSKGWTFTAEHNFDWGKTRMRWNMQSLAFVGASNFIIWLLDDK